MALQEQLRLDLEAIRDFCRRKRIAKLSLFGSVLKGTSGADSDVDFLVEFEPGQRISLFDAGAMAMELGELIGRRVDLRTPADLSPYFRAQVLREARPVYVG